PMYFTDLVDNPFSRGLTALDANGNPETVDQSKFPSATALWSPRLGFNWNASGERRTQLRGGTGIFTGRVPFVWIGNVISNPGAPENGAGAGRPASLRQLHVRRGSRLPGRERSWRQRAQPGRRRRDLRPRQRERGTLHQCDRAAAQELRVRSIGEHRVQLYR